jgi:glycosyltransferase involved in cell wall biosynthesis
MKKILYLTFYFEPDLCAGSFRNTPLAKKLAEIGGDNIDVHVITTQPNRYSSFRQTSEPHEKTRNLTIDRIDIPLHKSGFSDQIRSFIAYYRETKRIVKNTNYDLVVASSSRMFTAFLGKKIAKDLNCPLYLDVRDIFVDTMSDVIKNKILNRIVVSGIRTFVERPTFRYAKHINLISGGFKPYFSKYADAVYSSFPNGIDDIFFEAKKTKPSEALPLVITYAGNIGEGQGLHKIVPAAAKALGQNYLFKIIGDGGTRKELEEQIEGLGVNNVQLIKPMQRENIIQMYMQSDFLFLHLNDYDAFKKVLPSKLFEYGATNIPIIAGVGGFAADFIRENIPNTIVFEPCNVEQFVQAIQHYEYSLVERTTFHRNYSRDSINEMMAKSILDILEHA